jgi:hypothetical protein
MKSKNLIIVFFLLSQQIILAQDYSYKPKYSTILDSTKGSPILHQCSRAAPQKVETFWNPTQSDIDSLEKNLKKVLQLKAGLCCLMGSSVPFIENYGLQYIGIIIKKKKYIYINAFYISSDESIESRYKFWKESPVAACDGGKNFWGVLYDIENSAFEQLAINGIV